MNEFPTVVHDKDGKTYYLQTSFCGKDRCRRCHDGIGHGPYWYAYSSNEHGKTVRSYIGKTLPDHVITSQGGASQTYVRAQEGVSFTLSQTQASHRIFTLGRFALEHRTLAGWSKQQNPGWYHTRTRNLLAYLLCLPGRRHGREQIIETLWPDSDFERGSHSLDRAVYSLRNILEPERERLTTSLLATGHDQIQLAGQTSVWVDADAFDFLLAQAEHASDEQRLMLLREAAELYQGDFLTELDASGEEEAEDTGWALPRRDALHRAWVGMLLKLSELQFASGNEQEALAHLDQLLSVDPENEAALQHLMRQLMAVGRRGEALRAYQRALRHLRTLHIQPMPETQLLYEELRAGKHPSSSRGKYAIALAPKMRSSPSLVGLIRPYHKPLVGRSLQLETLQQIIQDATAHPRSNSPHLILLGGEAGIGKTRLSEETATLANQHNWVVLFSRAYLQEQMVPYTPFREIARQILTHSTFSQELLQTKALAYQPLHTLLPEIGSFLPHLPGRKAQPHQEKVHLWNALLHLLEDLRTPILVIIDDLQWIDSNSIELLGYLVRHLRGPILFLGTYRNTDVPLEHPLATLISTLTREQMISHILLPRLADEDLRTLAEDLPKQQQDEVILRAAGNPFFAEELARVIQAKLEEQSHGNFDSTSSRSSPLSSEQRQLSCALPETITAVMDLHLSRLSDPCQKLLATAAVLGGSFDLHLLYAMPNVDDQALDLLEEALQARLLSEERQGQALVYRFWHPLLTEHLYKRMSAARRALLHNRAVQALQKISRGQEAETAATILYHLQRGAARAEQIALYAELAGNYAYGLAAYAQAAAYYCLALEQSLPISFTNETAYRDHCLLLERASECSLLLGQVSLGLKYSTQAVEYHQQLLASARARSPEFYQQTAQIHAMLLVSQHYGLNVGAQFDEADRCSQEAEFVLSEVGIVQGSIWGMIRLEQARGKWMRGQTPHAFALAAEGLAFFEQALQESATQEWAAFEHSPLTQMQRTLMGNPVAVAKAYRLMGLIRACDGQANMYEAISYLQRALAIFNHHARTREAARSWLDLGCLYMNLMKHTQALDCLQRSEEEFYRIGDHLSLLVCHDNLGIIAERQGRIEDTHRYFRLALSQAEEVDDRIYCGYFASAYATFLLKEKREEQARILIEYAIRKGRSIRHQPTTGNGLLALGIYRLFQAFAPEGLPPLVPHQAKMAFTWQQHLLARARSLLERSFRFQPDPEFACEALYFRAQVSWYQGELDAVPQMRQVVEKATNCGICWVQARANLFLAGMFALTHDLSADEEVEQSQVLSTALRLFQEANCPQEYEQAQTLIPNCSLA